MKNRKNKHPLQRKSVRQQQNLLFGTLFIAVLLLCLPVKGIAQPYQRIYSWAGNSKAFSTEAIIGSPNTCVMAGTAYGQSFAQNNVTHFLHLDPLGVENTNIFFDDSEYVDCKTVDIVPDPYNDVYYIVTGARPHSTLVSPYVTPFNDRIRIIPVDSDGVMVDSAFVIYCNDPDEDLYPMSAVFEPAPAPNPGGYLYICGFWTDQNTIVENGDPDYTTNKQAFVIKYDVLNHTIAANDKVRFNTTYSGGGPNPPSDFDFDIAMKMKLNANNHLMITGSVNDIKCDVGGPTQYSGTMNIVCENLTDLLAGTVNYNHFTANNEDGGAANYDEIGMAIIEAQTSPPISYFIVGNTFTRINVSLGGGPSIMYPDPWYYWTTWIQDNYQIDYMGSGGYLSRWKNDQEYCWVLDAFPSSNLTVTNPLGATFTIAGMTNMRSACGGAVNNSIIIPFLFDQETFYSSSTVDVEPTNSPYMMMYDNQTGTGARGTANSYWNLGGWLSNEMFLPSSFASQYSNGDIVMSAPKWKNSGNLLNLKSLHVDKSTLSAGCGVEDDCAPPSTTPIYLYNLGHTSCGGPTNTVSTARSSLSVSIAQSSTFRWNYSSSETDCNAGGGPHYKTNGTQSIGKRPAKTMIYPNPTSDHIYVVLAKGIDNESNVNVSIQNVLGQKVGNLFDGNASLLNNHRELILPDLTSGVYLVTIHVNGKEALNEKLTVSK